MTGHQRPDSELLASLPARPESMGVLYERHAPAVFRYLARRAGRSAAEDLLSEVFIAALDGRITVEAHASGSALPWLYGIAGNVLRRHFRQGAAHWVAAPDPGWTGTRSMPGSTPSQHSRRRGQQRLHRLARAHRYRPPARRAGAGERPGQRSPPGLD